MANQKHLKTDPGRSGVVFRYLLLDDSNPQRISDNFLFFQIDDHIVVTFLVERQIGKLVHRHKRSVLVHKLQRLLSGFQEDRAIGFENLDLLLAFAGAPNPTVDDVKSKIVFQR